MHRTHYQHCQSIVNSKRPIGDLLCDISFGDKARDVLRSKLSLSLKPEASQRELNHHEVSTTDRVARIKRTKAEWEALLRKSAQSADKHHLKKSSKAKRQCLTRRETKDWLEELSLE